jgi:hypothetical protein
MWEGSAPVTTTAQYFGVKQYVRIIGDNTDGTPSDYRTGKVYGSVSDTWSNKNFVNVPISYSVYSKDSRNKNVVIDVLFNNGNGIVDGGTTHWLKNFNGEKQKFKDNFKIAYYANGGGSADDFIYRPDVVYINIKDINFFSDNPDGVENVGINAVRITLDPNYEINYSTKYFYISPEIRYDEKNVFGDTSNFLHGFFKAYAPSP